MSEECLEGEVHDLRDLRLCKNEDTLRRSLQTVSLEDLLQDLQACLHVQLLLHHRVQEEVKDRKEGTDLFVRELVIHAEVEVDHMEV